MRQRFYGFLWESDKTIRTLALLPRARLVRGPTVGLGVGWLTAWFHVWLWEWSGARGTYAYWRDRGSMLELLPYVWIHWSVHGAGIHLWWLQWRRHCWFYQRQDSEGGRP